MELSLASHKSLLQDVIEQRRSWIKSAMALDSATFEGAESRFVLEVIERAQKLRLDLAQDRYFFRSQRVMVEIDERRFARRRRVIEL